jgi:tetratricopeptide (TPR) repeat protein
MTSSTHSRADASALAAVLGLLATLVAPQVGAAASQDPTEEAAKAEFQRGQTAYHLGQFREALASYNKAYDLEPLPAILFDSAQCYRQLGDLERAVLFYRRYLATAPRGTRSAVTAQTLLDESLAQLAEQRRRTVLEAQTAARQQQPVGGLASSSVAAAEIPSHAIEKRPLYQQWWLWTAVGVVVAAAAGGTAAYLATAPKPPAANLGTVSAR